MSFPEDHPVYQARAQHGWTLKELSEKGLIEGEKRGKTITYSLTKEGKESFRGALRYFIRCFGDMLV